MRRLVIFPLIICLLLSLYVNLLTTSVSNTSTVSTGGNVYGDFDNDGYDDLAIGVQNEGIGTADGAGAVNVLYGSSSGLSSVGNQMWHQNSPGILGLSETDDRFGSALSVGDFDNDGYDDLVIGVPGEDIGTASSSGAVNILYGSSSGLSSTGNQMWHQNSPGILGISEDWDQFGRALASGDFDDDGYCDLAIGVSGEDIGSARWTGAVNVIYGSASGLSSAGNQLWHQNSPGIPGSCDEDDWFGRALASGDFNEDGYGDLAIGVVLEDVGTIAAAGIVHILYGSGSGLSASGNQIWHQNRPGIRGICELEEGFGCALAVNDMNGDGYDDLAIGVCSESIGGVAYAGAVQVLYGSSSGLSSMGNQLWHQNSYGILDMCNYKDWFGGVLASGDFNDDGYGDLAVGTPSEHKGGSYTGVVNVLYGSSRGLSSIGNQLWHQNSPGVLGICELEDFFGSALRIGDFDGDGYDDLAIGVPQESIGSIDEAGAVNVLYGSFSGLSSIGDQLWHQNRPGILGICEEDDWFGDALA
jgi:disulfide bond formation protein DsbB